MHETFLWWNAGMDEMPEKENFLGYVWAPMAILWEYIGFWMPASGALWLVFSLIGICLEPWFLMWRLGPYRADGNSWVSIQFLEMSRVAGVLYKLPGLNTEICASSQRIPHSKNNSWSDWVPAFPKMRMDWQVGGTFFPMNTQTRAKEVSD